MGAATSDIEFDDERLAKVVAERNQPQADWRAAQQACEQLYMRHARKLLAFLAARVSRSDLEDIHQGVWEKVWQRLPEAFHGGNFRAWLFQITRNYLVDLSRKKTPRFPGDHALDRPGREQAADVQMAEQERTAILRRCLARLSADAANLVRSRLAGEAYEEICKRLGWKTARAHKLFHEAKQQLQTCVEQAEA
jgi:RNA polymerase sigma factor (sigma-70 family)